MLITDRKDNNLLYERPEVPEGSDISGLSLEAIPAPGCPSLSGPTD